MRRAAPATSDCSSRCGGTAVASESKVTGDLSMPFLRRSSLLDEHREAMAVPYALGQGPLAAPGVEVDRAVGDRDAEGCADGSRHQTDFAAMGADQLGRNDEAEPSAAGARGALKRLKHMGLRLFRNPGASIGHLNHHHGAVAASGDADLVARRIARAARLQRLDGVARDIDQNAEQLI